MIEPSPFWIAYLTLLSFFFGACIGSFLNVCIYRIPEGLSVVTPRSRCPKCLTPIEWYDNIPLLGWLRLKGKCRACGVAISPRYFLVELLTGTLFLMVWNHYGFDMRTLIFWIAISGLILGTFVDFDHMIIPDRVSLGGQVIGLLCSVAFPVLHGKETHVEGAITSAIGLAVGFGSLWIVGYLGKLAFKKDAMGFGDVKLLGAMGAFLGWQGVLFIIMLSSLLGTVAGVSMIVTGHKEMQSRIPFGPYLSLAAVIWILGGHTWWTAYVNWIGGM